ncbi:MAG: tRNA (guanosine(46)-N7)-methyltransferase TrmB [Chlamydiales bacterium]
MKPKDLKSPYCFEDRRPCLQDGVFYVPEYYHQHEAFSLPHWEKIFDNANPVGIEFCAGNGDWIVEKATTHPESNWVAVEIRFDRVRKIWSKRENRGLKNLLIVCGEARTFVTHYVDEVQEVFVNFPDPWPKKRHEKHRLMQKDFLAELERIVRGSVIFVTDDKIYWESTLSLFGKSSLFSDPQFLKEVEGYRNSYFETLWREKGRNIYYTKFIKEADERIVGAEMALS